MPPCALGPSHSLVSAARRVSGGLSIASTGTQLQRVGFHRPREVAFAFRGFESAMKVPIKFLSREPDESIREKEGEREREVACIIATRADWLTHSSPAMISYSRLYDNEKYILSSALHARAGDDLHLADVGRNASHNK